MNVESLVIDDKPVIIADDFFSKEICSDWLRYYMNSGFVINAVEYAQTEAEGDSLFYFTHGMTKQDLEKVFRMSSTILPLVNEWNEKNGTDFKYTDCVRTHINLTQECDSFRGHVDHLTRDILIFLWFGNPYFKDEGGGFYLGEDKNTLIEHKFNRCVIFPGTLFHQIQDVIDKSEIRLSVYIGFQKQDGKQKDLYFDPATLKNALHKDAFVMEKLTKDLHKDFGIGN